MTRGALCVLVPLTTQTLESPAICSDSGDNYLLFTLFVVRSVFNKKPQLWLRNQRDATAFQIHPEEIHRNDDDDDDFSFTSHRNEHSVRLLWLHTA